MNLRVISVLCVLACLAGSISALSFSAEEAGSPGSAECAEVVVSVREETDTSSFTFATSSPDNDAVIAISPVPRMVYLERAGNFFLVRNAVSSAEPLVTTWCIVTVDNVTPGGGPDTGRHTLAPGESGFFAAPVPDGASQFWVDICWDASAGDLQLQIYSPDGSLGPYTDVDDGRRDGRIFLRIASPEGLPQDDWYYEISRTGGGPVEFSLETYG